MVPPGVGEIRADAVTEIATLGAVIVAGLAGVAIVWGFRRFGWRHAEQTNLASQRRNEWALLGKDNTDTSWLKRDGDSYINAEPARVVAVVKMNAGKP